MSINAFWSEYLHSYSRKRTKNKAKFFKICTNVKQNIISGDAKTRYFGNHNNFSVKPFSNSSLQIENAEISLFERHRQFG